MKITQIKIVLTPSEKEIDNGMMKKVLIRNENKNWFVENQEGLHPADISLAMEIQNAIGRYTSSEKKE